MSQGCHHITVYFRVRDCRYFTEGEVLKILKGNKALIKSLIVGNLYKLIGSTIKVKLGNLYS